jgi:hypothetical protein
MEDRKIVEGGSYTYYPVQKEGALDIEVELEGNSREDGKQLLGEMFEWDQGI